MAISPPSDIVLDVAMAADPARRQMAASRLAQLGGAARAQAAGELPLLPPVPPAVSDRPARVVRTAPSFSEPASPTAFDVHRARLQLRDQTIASRAAASAEPPSGTDKRREAMQKFEAMVLQTFIGSMLPQNAEGVYGKGTAGDIWKSMLSEQLGRQTAKAGGIGIADRLLNPNVMAARVTRF